jgi:RNA polymerase sigma-70 factor (ECF subfamily)
VEHEHTEEPLIDPLRSGDPAAFEAIYARERKPVYAFLVRLSGDTNVAADLFQNVWLKLARYAPQLRRDTRIRAWLLTVARHEFISYRRAQALDLSLLLTLDRPAATLEPSDPRLSELAAALARLGDRDREVLLLTSVDGLDVDRAARALDVSAVALRQRLSRARRRLSEALEALAAEPAALAVKAGR